MKFGNHQNSCNGPGDCNCGQDYREMASRAVDRYINEPSVDKLKAEIKNLKEEVEYWKAEARESK